MPRLIICTTVATFVAANLIVFIKADGNTAENSQNTTSNVDPLPQKFSPELRDILSPDIFTQTDPLNYLREKVKNLRYRTMDNMDWDLHTACTGGRFPTAYLPYAKLLRSLLFCIVRLNDVKIFINTKKEPIMFASHRLRPNTSSLDHELSSLFSSDIFFDSNPPSVLIDKLIALPETRLSSIGKEMRFSEDPVVKYYFWYSRYLSQFLENENYMKGLRDLRLNLAEIRQLKLYPPAD